MLFMYICKVCNINVQRTVASNSIQGISFEQLVKLHSGTAVSKPVKHYSPCRYNYIDLNFSDSGGKI